MTRVEAVLDLPERVEERLLKRLHETQAVKDSVASQLAEAEVATCTFKPVINSQTPWIPKSYKPIQHR